MNSDPARSRRFVALLCVSAFGPYVAPGAGLRLEHLVIYGSLAYIGVTALASRRDPRICGNVLLLLVPSIAVACWVLVSTLKNLGSATPYGIAAGLENFTQPVALILIVSAAMERFDRAERLGLVRIASVATISMLCINSLLAVSAIFTDTWPFVQYFVTVSPEVDHLSVSQLAARMGRFLGIFNQPAESGLAYSIGLLLWVYLVTTIRRMNVVAWVSLLLLVIGGSLSISKTFIVGGVPLSLFYWSWVVATSLRFRKSTIAGFLAFGMGGGTVVSVLLGSWSGVDFFGRLFRWDSLDFGIIYLFTGTRFGGEESGVGSLFIKTWSEARIMGFGVANEQVLDNGFLEFFFYGGTVGLFIHVCLLVSILIVAYRALRFDPALGRLLTVFWVLIVGASIGAPALTLNRSSIFLWIVLVTAFGALAKRSHATIGVANTHQSVV